MDSKMDVIKWQIWTLGQAILVLRLTSDKTGLHTVAVPSLFSFTPLSQVENIMLHTILDNKGLIISVARK